METVLQSSGGRQEKRPQLKEKATPVPQLSSNPHDIRFQLFGSALLQLPTIYGKSIGLCQYHHLLGCLHEEYLNKCPDFSRNSCCISTLSSNTLKTSQIAQTKPINRATRWLDDTEVITLDEGPVMTKTPRTKAVPSAPKESFSSPLFDPTHKIEGP
ncbi:hypothetical protein F511_26048 [Dorcoceras hygrometricum]|uniref:Uncharacterized protein n=1 Tax=Dorcoceras hygrometricum TaxID=472368 RepID=A0A2Z7CUF4_9LAMI|nr:hypothetical protein F511_26048 [Dorcoceras hygrometricum]